MPIIDNQLGKRVVIRVTNTATPETYVLADLIKAGTPTENVLRFGITQVFWLGAGSIARGSNPILTFAAGTQGHFNFAASGISLNEFNTDNVVITSSVGGFIIVELSKTSSWTTVY